MGFFSKLFSSAEVVKDVSNGIDKAFYTDEEKAEGFAKLLRLYEPFKLAQRYLALIFAPAYALCAVVTFAASFFVDVSAQVELMSGMFGYIVLTIIGFYFGGGAVEGLIEKARANR